MMLKLKTCHLTKLFIVLFCIVCLIRCDNNHSIEPGKSNDQKQSVATPKVIQQITFLKAKTLKLNKVFDVSQLITSAKGGKVEIGDSLTGYSSLTFNAGTLKEDVMVGFWWNSQNFQAEFSPHGITFQDSVSIRLSYVDADLTNINEDSLGIWCYDEINQQWELIGQNVDKVNKNVAGRTMHFSRFAIGAE